MVDPYGLFNLLGVGSAEGAGVGDMAGEICDSRYCDPCPPQGSPWGHPGCTLASAISGGVMGCLGSYLSDEGLEEAIKNAIYAIISELTGTNVGNYCRLFSDL